MPKVLITDNVAAEGIDLLKKHVPVDVKRGLSPEELIATIPGYDALVVRSETRVTESVIVAGADLKVVARAGIGVDNIDLDAATRAGVAVVNAPIGNTVAAAEHTVALMLALARNVPQAYASMKEGQWQRSAFMGIEVRNKTLGIIGLGRVGSEVARRAASFGMRLIAYDPFVAPDFAARMGVTVVSLDELLPQADFITLHTPLTAGTTRLISAPQLAKMKPGARLINVARGELVDEDALLDALESEHLAGAALDVFTNEPPGDLPLLKHPQARRHAAPGRVHPGSPARGRHRGRRAGAGRAGWKTSPQHRQRALRAAGGPRDPGPLRAGGVHGGPPADQHGAGAVCWDHHPVRRRNRGAQHRHTEGRGSGWPAGTGQRRGGQHDQRTGARPATRPADHRADLR